MGVIETADSPAGKERLKWEYADFSLNGVRGLRGPRVFEEFPKQMSLAGRNDSGKIVILREERAGDADEEQRWYDAGFRFGHDKAIEAHEAREKEIATLAANRAYQDRTLSEAARKEADAYESETYGHVAEIPAAPVVKRGPGRPRRAPETE
jgi:hypothetical protein